MDGKRLWAIRAGSAGEVDTVFMDMGQIAISSVEAGDDLASLPATRGAFRDLLAQSRNAGSAIPIQAGQLYRFVHELRIGDLLIYPRKCDRTLHLGEVTGPYVFETEGLPEFAHRRAVRWMGSRGRDVFSQAALFELGSALTLFEIKTGMREILLKFSERNDAMRPAGEDELDGSDEYVVRDVNETTSDFIARRLKSRFKGYPFEPLVAELFRAMGYRAQTTRASHDDGVDVIAHRDELGIEPPIFKIQVKTNEANIGSDSVKAFAAMVQDRDVGIFITTGNFTSGAREFTRTRGNLKLVNGVELVGLIQKYYDNLALKFRQQIPLRRVWVPDVDAGAG